MVADDETGVAIEHDEALRHVGDRRIEAQVLRLKIGFALSQLPRPLDHDLLELAVDRVDLLDHQRDRPVGPTPVAIDLVIGIFDQRNELIDVDFAGQRARFGGLPGKEAMHS